MKFIYYIILIITMFTSCSPSINSKVAIETHYYKELTNINTASKSSLMELRGIGEVKSQKIIEHRNKSKFNDKYELLEYNLIGKTTFNNIKEEIII